MNSKTKTFKAESGHWYTQEGDPMYTIVGVNGKKRNTNLRDAKQLGLVPSVTTIIGMIAKPSLENWKINQALKSAITLKQLDGESFNTFLYRCKKDAKSIGLNAAKEGYGGKIDLYSKSGIFIDFKTKSNIEDKEPSKLVFDEHGMQLSAYAQGCNCSDPERISIFIDRENIETIKYYVWEKESHSRHVNMFNSILSYWQLVKNHDSTVKANA